MQKETNILQLIREESTKESAFRTLVQTYGNRLYWHIRRIVVGHDDAEDVLQDSLIKVYAAIGDFNGDESQLQSWLYRIATNESLQLLRKKKHFFQSIDDLSPALTATLVAENAVNLHTAEMELHKAVLSLPTTQRLVFYMRYYDDLSYEEISVATGKSINTLKTNYHLASKTIQKHIKDISI
ncbi:MAG: RNA polymerase sigma factor [Bacteroidales bacterium]|nr:RNA polymerase sigma factor [Bacteroidales bacterium]